MAGNTLIENLLDLWEEQRNQGTSLSPEDFVRQHGSHLTAEQAAELRQAIRDLMDMDRALDTAAEAATPGDADGASDSSRTGQSVTAQARFRVDRLHARGGLGEVYVANDEAMGRDVALKVIQPNRARLSPSRGRFLREARLTSRLQHPGIVPVYGSGEDGEGTPFYVMRFVSGRTLHEAIWEQHRPEGTNADPSARRLGFQQLLRRFVTICDTVAYAHSRGVLHRDLKPSNILVGEFGETLVVDWGLAKVTGSSRDDEDSVPAPGDKVLPGAVTHEGAVIGTPGYMSPEQARGEVERLSPASDIYSLGTILYTILTGRGPFDDAKSSGVLGRNQANLFPAPRKVVADLSNALEAICLKAMASRPADRYASAADLGKDVERWLADEPVSAWREPWTVRARRWLTRHRTLTTSVAAAVVVALVSMTVATLLLNVAWREADKQRELADKRSIQARRAVNDFFTDVSENPRFLRDDPGTQEIRRTLLERARKYYEEFLEDQGGNPALRAETARASFRLAMVLLELNETDQALVHLQRTRDLLERLTVIIQDPDLVHDLALTYSNMATLKGAKGNIEEARQDYLAALLLHQRLSQEQPGVIGYIRGTAQTFYDMGRTEFNDGDLEAARSCFEDARALREGLHREKPDLVVFAHELAVTDNALGHLEGVAGNFDKGRALHEEARALLDRFGRENPRLDYLAAELAETHYEIGGLAYLQRKGDDALTAYQAALQLRQKLASENPAVPLYQFNLANTHSQLSRVYHDLGKKTEALDHCQKAIAIHEEVCQKQPTARFIVEGLVPAYRTLGDYLRRADKLDEAREVVEKARERTEQVSREQPAQVAGRNTLAGIYIDLAALHRLGNRPAESLAFLEKARVVWEKLTADQPSVPLHARHLASTHYKLGMHYHIERDTKKALAHYEQAVKLFQRLPAKVLALPDVAGELAQAQKRIASIRQEK